MKTPHMFSRPVMTVLLVSALALLAYQSFGFRPAPPGAGGPTQPVIIATFDLERTINSADEYKSLLESVRKQAETMAANSEAQRKAIKQLEDQLQDFNEQSPKHRELLEKIAQQTSEYRAYSDYVAYKIDRDRAKALLQSYKSVRRAAEDIAMHNHYALVLVDDSITDVLPGNEQDVKRQIAGRRMVFTGPEVDITDAMIQSMNEAFKNAGGVPPAPRKEGADSPTKNAP